MNIEPLDPKRHDRTSFASGVGPVDNYLRKTANKLAQADNVRAFVLVSREGRIVGYYTLNAHDIHYSDLPGSFARNRPSHGRIPAAFISMIGVDARYQGQGYGGLLLADALKRIYRASRDLGIAVVLLDVLDCGDPVQVERRKQLYLRYGFRALSEAPLRLYLPVATIGQLIEAP